MRITHGALLLTVIRQIDGFAKTTIANGDRPFVDAVELVRLLRALVEARSHHEPLQFKAPACGEAKALTLGWEWKPSPSDDDDDAEDDDS